MSDNKVIEFKKKRSHDDVFECTCGSQSFYLIKGGDIQCRSCNEIKSMRWFSPDESFPGANK